MTPNTVEQTRTNDNRDIAAPSSAISSSPDPGEAGVGAPWPLLLFVCLISLLINGHHLYRANQGVEFPYTCFLADPSLYANDPLVATVRHHATLFWRGIAIAMRVVPLESLMLGVFILERLLALYAISRIARTLAPKSKLALLGALLVVAFIPEPFIGSGTTLPDYTEQSGLAIAVLLMAGAFLIERSYWRWALCAGLAVNLNALYVLYFLVYSGAIFMAERRPLGEWLAAILSLPLMIACASPVLIFVFSAPHQQMPDRALWFDAMFGRSALHLLPLTWPKVGYLEYFSLVAATLGIALFSARRQSQLARVAIAATVVSLLWLALAFVAAYLVRSPLLLQIQPGRGTDLWYFFAGFVVVCFLADLLTRLFGNGILSLICLIALFIPLAWGPSHQHQSAVLFLVAFASLGLFAFAEGADGRRKTLVYRSIAFAMAVGVTGVGLVKEARAAQPIRLFGTPLSARDYEVFDAARFAAAHTGKDAVFVVDPTNRSLEPFRAVARRSVFVEYKDGTAFFYDFAYVTEWCDRMTAAGVDAGINRKPTARPYASWDDSDIARLASKYKVDFWIVPATHRSSLKSIWTGRYWKILAIGPFAMRPSI